jgi:hypothetical protein
MSDTKEAGRGRDGREADRESEGRRDEPGTGRRESEPTATAPQRATGGGAGGERDESQPTIHPNRVAGHVSLKNRSRLILRVADGPTAHTLGGVAVQPTQGPIPLK